MGTSYLHNVEDSFKSSRFGRGLNRLLSAPGDTDETLVVKHIWFFLAVASIAYPLIEAAILALQGNYDVWYLRLGIGISILALLVYFIVHKKHLGALGFLLCLDLIVMTGLIQFLKGGLLHSMGIVFIGLSASVLSLIFVSARKAHILFGLFLAFMIGGTLLQPYMSPGDQTYDLSYKVMYISKFLVGSMALYFGTLYFYWQFHRIKENEKAALQALDDAKTKFYTNMTHEFRTPLSMIMGWAEHISDAPDQHLDEGLDTIQRNGKKLLELVDQLMDISKIEAGSLKLNYANGDMVRLVKALVEEYRGVARLQGVRLHFTSDRQTCFMDYDEAKVESVISNLISNAIKFTPREGDIHICTNTINDHFILRITDTGQGIAQEHLPHVFDRFYQADDSATRKTGGSGIGLAVAKGLVELMHGTISVTSPDGHGATFEIRVPIMNNSKVNGRIADSKDNSAVEVNTLDTLETEALQSDRPVILIVEDNPDMLTFLDSILSDYKVILAKDGKEGLQFAFKHIPDLVISDIMMPGMDGYELTTKMKADIRTSHIPLILLTAKADIDSRIEGLELGAEAYLTKPFSKRELLVRVRKLFDLRKTLQDHYWKIYEMNGNGYSNAVLPKQENAFLTRVRKTIKAHLDDPGLNVAALTNELHMSYSQLYRKIRSLTGRTPNHFIQSIRLKKARDLLVQSDVTIAEAAFEAGFEDPAYFSRVFKKTFGVSPSNYRDGHATHNSSTVSS